MLQSCCRVALRLQTPVQAQLKLVNFPAHRRPALSRCLLARSTSTAVFEQQISVASIMTEPLAAASRADEGEYKAQLEHKISRVKDLFQDFQLPELGVFESQRSHYRMRCGTAI